MQTGTYISLALYFVLMIAIGLWAWKRSTDTSEGYLLAGRNLPPAVAALSAGASDMSGWLLLGLPGALYASGLVEAWIGIGLFIGALANWFVVAPRLRAQTESYGNALTIPEFLANRFPDKAVALRVISALIVVVFFAVYTAAGLVGGGKLFETSFAGLFGGIGMSDYMVGIWITALVVLAYTMVGGFLAVSLTDFVQGLIMVVALAVMPLVAAYDAEDDEIGLRRATRMGLWLSVGFAMIALPAMIWSPAVLDLLGQGPNLADTAGDYLKVAGWGIVPALLVMVLKSYLAALERTQVVLWITLAAVGLNVLVNHALIFGNWGLPELGVRGAAIASLTVNTASLIALAIYAALVQPDHALFQRVWRPDPEALAQVFRLGWPIGITNLAEVGLFAASSVMMGWLGPLPLAAHGIALQVTSVVFMVHLGLSLIHI